MSLNSNFAGPHLKSPLTTHRNFVIPLRRTFQVREYSLWRRRRLKTNLNSAVISQLSPFENFFHDLASQFPSVYSLVLITPALGFASGVALYLSRLKSKRNSRASDVGESILFTSPTPFNRFVMLRCPSISFEGSELLEGVNEKLMKEDRHFVRLSSGRIQNCGGDESDDAVEERPVYQRVCVTAEDGGVISLDWPVNLDLTEERGLDTTLLLIPGTAEGSMDKNISSFVCESLRRGCFPVVMNPRGCAGSPLTTARLFTAADSDDICTAIQFIKRARPWTTLMGVGWGHGANMLTKYLAEVADRTPLIAATCIDNPFDLEEATRSSPHQKLTGGLRDILQSNKELFRGREKGFDVEKALLAKSVRDFEKEISMISYGFDAIEDFYAKSSTRGVIGNVKIPVLFIQNDDGTVPLFSVPRSLIAENPFTSLLLCSCSLSGVIVSGRSAVSWYQNLTIEWLAAVELGLLKGRHPLLKDVDVTVNPSQGLAWYDAYPAEELLGESDTMGGISSRFRRDSQKIPEIEDKGLQPEAPGPLEQSSSVDAELIEDEASHIDNQRGQVLQTAQAVMNILDVTIPDTLTEEKKKKVLAAVGQGETIMKALQDAIPEEFREKLQTAVSGILHNQGTNLTLDGLSHSSPIPDVASGLKSKIQDRLASARGHSDPHTSSDPRSKVDDLTNNSNHNQDSVDKPAGGLESELQASEALKRANDSGHWQSTSPGDDSSSSLKPDTSKWENIQGNPDMSRERDAHCTDCIENGSTGAEPDLISQTERDGLGEDETIDPNKVEENGGLAKFNVKEEDDIQHNVEVANSSTDHTMAMSSPKEEEGSPLPVSSHESQLVVGEGSDNLRREETSVDSVSNQNTSDSPTSSVSQALGALTGMDDSTQVAVNSVFGVIEDMITQLEAKKGEETSVQDKKDAEDSRTISEIHSNSMRKEGNAHELESKSHMVDSLPSFDGRDSCNESNDVRTRWVEEDRPIRSTDLVNGNNTSSSSENDLGSHIVKEVNSKREHLASSKLVKCSNQATSQYDDSLYKECIRKHLISKMSNTSSLDLDTTIPVFLDFFAEKDQGKLLELPGDVEHSSSDIGNHEGSKKNMLAHSPSAADTIEVIEPQYHILDSEEQHESVQGYATAANTNQEDVVCNDSSELMSFVKNITLDSLKVEAGRRLGAANTKEIDSNLSRDMEEVANAVSLAAGHNKDRILFLERKECSSEKVGTLNAEHMIKAISLAVQEAHYLRRVIPAGVVAGSILASLRKFLIVTATDNGDDNEGTSLDQTTHPTERNRARLFETKAVRVLPNEIDQNYDGSISRDWDRAKSRIQYNDTIIVGSVTAALGASALLVHQQGMKESEGGSKTSKTLSKSFEEKGNCQKVPDKLEEESSEKNQNTIVTGLAEKAMSVAGPVVPIKQDGEVDQDRLVAMLADWGQKGGMLKLLGKIALLWGGIRGAMSLTDRLILFLRISERPLFQRILGFVCMVAVIWAPIVVPLLPTLLQSWATQKSSKIAELVCIVGLYASIVILVMIWGKRIRGFEKPFEQYGLDFASLPKVQIFLMGFVGGVMLVFSIHSLNVLLGFVRLSWPSTFISHPSDGVRCLKVFGKMLLIVGQGIVTATGVALVEELLFRSWLSDEIAAELGYYRGIIISGLAFSLFQRSPRAIPGLWLLSLGLAGARQRNQGSLSLPIGLRSGILASSFVLQMGSFLTYQPNFPLWVTGSHSFQPFSGVAGLAFALILAIVLYPRQPLNQPEKTSSTRE